MWSVYFLSVYNFGMIGTDLGQICMYSIYSTHPTLAAGEGELRLGHV